MAGKAPILEKRKWLRIPLTIPVFVRGVDVRGKEFLEFTSTLDLSAGGALIHLQKQLPWRSQVSLEIPAAPLPPSSFSHRAVRVLKARVLRFDHSDGYVLWALRFTHPLAKSSPAATMYPS